MLLKSKESHCTDEQEFMALFSDLPPVIARDAVEKFFGGLFSRKTLANHDAKGTGPDESFAVGKKIVYRKEALLRWIYTNYDIKRLHSIKDLGA